MNSERKEEGMSGVEDAMKCTKKQLAESVVGLRADLQKTREAENRISHARNVERVEMEGKLRSASIRRDEAERVIEDVRLMVRLLLEEHYPGELQTLPPEMRKPSSPKPADHGPLARALSCILRRLPRKPDAFDENTCSGFGSSSGILAEGMAPSFVPGQFNEKFCGGK